MLDSQLRIKRDFHGKHLFVVKTSSRVFYLVANTEEEMNGWISSISQICRFGNLDEAESADEASSLTPTSIQPSVDSDQTSLASQPDSSYPRDYLLLSQCETRFITTRQDSFTNSDISLERRLSDEAAKDAHVESSSSSISHMSRSPSLYSNGRMTSAPFSAPCSAPCSFPVLPSSSSSPLHHCAANVFQFDKPFSSPAPFEAAGDPQTPPPLPPKPNHLSELLSNGGAPRSNTFSPQHFPVSAPVFSRRTSLPGLDHMTMGNAESRLMRNRRQSINLPCLNTVQVQSYQDESYVPMASPFPQLSSVEGDSYIPMSPRNFTFLSANCRADSSSSVNPLMCQPGEIAPPPIHRHLKPRLRRARPPPLDLRGLSTITEFPTHIPLSRVMTDSCFPLTQLPLDRRLENGDSSRDDVPNCSALESRQSFCYPLDGAAQPWKRSSNLDYLSLDFNSASPSPVQKKPFLSDEYKVDYVQVDEKKTQALQNTKMEWKDVRQSKT